MRFWILDFGFWIGLIRSVFSIEKIAAVPTVAAFSVVGLDGDNQSKIQNPKSKIASRAMFQRVLALHPNDPNARAALAQVQQLMKESP